MKKTGILILLIIFAAPAFAQAEKRDVRKGNKAYKAEQYEAAEIAYMHGLDKNPESEKAHFNLGDALYKLNRQEQAEKTFGELSKIEADSSQKAAIFHNLGNTQLQQKKWQESVNSYKQALRYRPSDMETKQNLAYAQMMLQNEQNQQNQNQQNKDNKDNKEQDKNQQNKDQNKDNKDNQDKQNQEQPQNKDQQQDKKNQEQPQNQPEPKISKQDAQRMLEAVQADEKETQDKVKKEKAKVLQQQKIEKNW